MIPNFLVIVLTALLPFVVAMLWFHPKLFGGENWKQIAGLSDAQNNKAVKPIKLVLSIFLNLFVAFGLYNLCVHPAGVLSMVGGETEAMMSGSARNFLDEYALNYLSFGHGALHGFVSGLICFVVPILGYVTIFERRSTKYFLVNLGYWMINMLLMGGVICQWGWQWAI